MGDFFNNIVIFLEDYYVYVIGVGLIIILMLIGLLASKRKANKNSKSNDGQMANINEVSTGSINDVANTLQSDVVQPVEPVTFPEESGPTPASVFEPQPAGPAFSGPAPMVEPQPVEPVVFESQPTIDSQPVTPTFSEPTIDPQPVEPQPAASVFPEPTPIVEPQPVEPQPVEPQPAEPQPAEPVQVVSSWETVAPSMSPITPEAVTTEANEPNIAQPIVEETEPVSDDRFDKTEVIDFSSINPMPPTPTPIEPQPSDIPPFVIDKSQYVATDILNGEESSAEEPKV